jgi:hypothetical protein
MLVSSGARSHPALARAGFQARLTITDALVMVRSRFLQGI